MKLFSACHGFYVCFILTGGQFYFIFYVYWFDITSAEGCAAHKSMLFIYFKKKMEKHVFMPYVYKNKHIDAFLSN